MLNYLESVNFSATNHFGHNTDEVTFVARPQMRKIIQACILPAKDGDE